MAENPNLPPSSDVPEHDFGTIEAYANRSAKKPLEPIRLPPEYNHTFGNFAYESPLADESLAAVRKRLAEQPGTKPNILELLWIVQNESSDIKKQQQEQESKHPESIMQRELISEAYFYLSKSGNKDKEEVTISVSDDPHEQKPFFVGEYSGMQTYVIKRDGLREAYIETNSFKQALEDNDIVAMGLENISMGEFPRRIYRTKIKNYLYKQQQAWAFREMKAKTNEERKIARDNVNIFNDLTDDLELTFKSAEKIEEDVDTINEFDIAREERDEKEKADKQVIDAAQTIADEATWDERDVLNATEQIIEEALPNERDLLNKPLEATEDILKKASKKFDEKGNLKFPQRRFFYKKK